MLGVAAAAGSLHNGQQEPQIPESRKPWFLLLLVLLRLLRQRRAWDATCSGAGEENRRADCC